MKLKKDKWVSIQIGSIVSELRNSSTNPIKDGYERYIGFEHIESENIYLKKFGDLNDGVSFKKTFQKNDILFGKIRAYLKKVAIAPIDGICSGDILVLRTKDEKKLSQELLAYFLTTESFLKRAVDSSIGTTLPRTKWQHLSKHEISLPPLEEQKQIAVLFQSIETAMEEVGGQEKNLKSLRLKLIDSLCEMNESISKAFKISEWKKYKIEDVAYWYQRDIPNDKQKEEGIENYIEADHIEPGEIFISRNGTLSDSKKGPTITKHFRKGDFLLSTRSIALHKAAVAQVSGVTGEKLIVIDVLESAKIIKELLPYIMHSSKFWGFAKITASGSVNKFSSWNKIKLYEFCLPKLKEQEKLLEIFKQVETVIEQLKQQKTTLKNLKHKLLNEILG
jgi:type I restriction enzyme, S subunit